MRFLLFFFILTTHIYSQTPNFDQKLVDRLEKVVIGGRIQGIIDSNAGGEGTNDIYLRRLRVNLGYKINDNQSIVYDVRNDRANFEDKGDGKFAIGDAYWQIKMNKSWLKNIRLFRAKVDVSYSQTSSSKHLFNPNRALVSDHAADYIISGRRAANIQANGNLGRLAYQVAVSDGVSAKNLRAAAGGSEVTSIENQNLTYGAKLRYYFFGDARKNSVKDTFYGKSDNFSLGLGHFINDKLTVETSGANEKLNLNRSLTNIDLSFSLGGFRLLSEYFYFKDNIINLDNSSPLGLASGHYTQIEYVDEKWAPYIGYEFFDQWITQDDYKIESYFLGLNFYKNLEAERYGITYKVMDKEELVGDGKSESLYAYVMLHF